jgi:hypothetical protein
LQAEVTMMKLNEEKRANIKEKDLLKNELVGLFVIFNVMSMLLLHEFVTAIVLAI